MARPVKVGQTESALDRRERLLAKRDNRKPMDENLRRIREAEYPTRITNRA